MSAVEPASRDRARCARVEPRLAWRRWFSIASTKRRPAAGMQAGIEAGIEASVRSLGDSRDLALAEPINRLSKAEVIRCNGPRRAESHQVRDARRAQSLQHQTAPPALPYAFGGTGCGRVPGIWSFPENPGAVRWPATRLAAGAQ